MSNEHKNFLRKTRINKLVRSNSAKEIFEKNITSDIKSELIKSDAEKNLYEYLL